jgi:phage terminase small subunit
MNTQQFAPNKQLTPKQEKMIVERLKDKTAPNYEIIKRAGYNAKTIHAQSQQYLENMNKPEIASRLEPVVDEIEEALITTVRRYKDSDKLPEVQEAMNNARWIHDKVKGKATQKIEQQSTKLAINIDLTGTE